MTSALLRILLPPLFALAVLAAVVAVLVACLRAARGDRRLLARVGQLAAAGAMAWAALLMAWPRAVPETALAPGGELHFCGLDCHMHLSVVRAEAGEPWRLTLRLRSDAGRVPDFPRYLRLRVIGSDGRRYVPDASAFAAPLAAGADDRREITVALPPGVRPDRLVASWADWPGVVIPGPDQRWVRERTALLVPAPGGGDA